MSDYGVKAPTEQIIIDNLVAAGLGSIEEDGFTAAPGVAYVYLGQLAKEEGEPPILTEDVHADLRIYGPSEVALVMSLKSRTKVALKSDPVDGAPVSEGRADGFKIYPHAALKTPSHRFWD